MKLAKPRSTLHPARPVSVRVIANSSPFEAARPNPCAAGEGGFNCGDARPKPGPSLAQARPSIAASRPIRRAMRKRLQNFGVECGWGPGMTPPGRHPDDRSRGDARIGRDGVTWPAPST